MLSETLWREFQALLPEDAGELAPLTELPGHYINLECTLPNGQRGQLLDDGKTYWAAEVHKEGSERCYGLAGDEGQLVVYEYGCGGADARLVLWKSRG